MEVQIIVDLVEQHDGDVWAGLRISRGERLHVPAVQAGITCLKPLRL